MTASYPVRRPGRVATLALIVLLSITAVARADLPVAPGPDEGGTPVTLLDRRYDTERDIRLALGELAFKSTELLVGNFSCDSCHPDGATTSTLFYPGLSNRPGNIDMTNRALTMVEDGIFNPVNIPTLLGVRETAPYGRRGQFETVADFTRFAIVAEFGGAEPSELLLDAIVAFQEALDFPANAGLDAAGRLVQPPPAAARGEVLFRTAGSSGRSCADCHRPERGFIDGATHDVGTGGPIDTPSLRGLTETPPYLHDGRFATIAETSSHFVELFSPELSEADRADLVAYLEAVGTVDPPAVPTAREWDEGLGAALLRTALAHEDRLLSKLVVDQLARELRDPERSPPFLDRAAATRLVAALRAIEAHVTRAGFTEVWALVEAYEGLATAVATGPS